MKNKIEVRNVIIFIVILVVFTLLYIVIDKIMNDDDLGYEEYLKNYEVNEYIPVYVSDEDMAKMYLNDFVHTMYSDIEKAYNILSEEYKLKKFSNITDFENYINSLNYSSYKVERYYVNTSGKYKIFGVYDTNGNVFIFKTNGVMQYTVYLDDYTVEI